MMIFGLFLALLFLSLIFLLSKKLSIDQEKNAPFECGFSPKLSSRAPFSLQFFLITLIFLIFDVELILMFPILAHLYPSLALFNLDVLVAFILILTTGLFWEWAQGMLEWTPY